MDDGRRQVELWPRRGIFVEVAPGRKPMLAFLMLAMKQLVHCLKCYLTDLVLLELEIFAYVRAIFRVLVQRNCATLLRMQTVR